MAKIVVTHGVPSEGFSVLEGHELVIPAPLTAFSREELQRHMADADAVVAVGAVTGEDIAKAKNLKIIANYGAGYDYVDTIAAAARGIYVTNIPEQVAGATAEMAVGLMLAAARRIGEMNLRLRREAPESLFGTGRNMGMTLGGKVLGVVGCGRIGSRVAVIAKALGMRVLGYSRRGCDPAVAEPVSFSELLARADVISLNCPLTEETRGLIGREAFAQMKRGVILVNTARGPVVDTDALTEALDGGIVAAAGIDVYPDEPHIPQALIARENVVLTPHHGSNTAETRYNMARACGMQILDALAGKRPENVVNGL